MTENMKKFMEAAESDAALAAALQEMKTPEEFLELAAQKGFTLTQEDVDSLAPQTGELADEELENVSGGGLLSFLWNLLFGKKETRNTVKSSTQGVLRTNTLVHTGGQLQASTLVKNGKTPQVSTLEIRGNSGTGGFTNI